MQDLNLHERVSNRIYGTGKVPGMKILVKKVAHLLRFLMKKIVEPPSLFLGKEFELSYNFLMLMSR